MTYNKALNFLMTIILFVFPLGAYAENIDPGNYGSKYAYGENVGWINMKPLQGPGITVTNAAVTGIAWGENIGWINFNPQNGGVVNDGNGNLSGYAWGENVGWITFNPPGAGVKIDPITGVFSGMAWGENIGWIDFVPDGKPVKTSWRAVIYDFLGAGGFKPPIKNPPVTNIVQAGSTVPVKWQLPDGTGGYISDLGAVTSVTFQQVMCSELSATLTEPVDTPATGGTGLRYDFTAAQYIYNWQTYKAWAGKCYVLILTLNDGMSYQADFSLK